MKFILDIDYRNARWIEKVYKDKIENIIRDAIQGYFENALYELEDEGRKWLTEKEWKELVKKGELMHRRNFPVVKKVVIQK